MRKIDRLFEIVQALRGKRLRTAQEIAREIGVSIRTIYRDIDALVKSGVPIEGERGIGYIIRTPIELPPLQFNARELSALKFGLDIVRAISDKEIVKAAEEAFLKIQAVIPLNSKKIKTPASIFYSFDDGMRQKLEIMRRALEINSKLEIEYIDLNGAPSVRIVRPLGIEYWGKVWTLSAWCELRGGFRVFRIDKITKCVEKGGFFEIESDKNYAAFCKTQCLEYCVQNGMI